MPWKGDFLEISLVVLIAWVGVVLQTSVPVSQGAAVAGQEQAVGRQHCHLLGLALPLVWSSNMILK